MLGLLFPDLGKPADAESESALFVDQVIRGAERAATLAGSALVLAGARGRAGRQLVDALAAKVDGLVVVPRALAAAKLVEVSAAVPVVVLSPLGLTAPLDFVTAENRQAVRDLVAHLTGATRLLRPGVRRRSAGFAGLDGAVPRLPGRVGRRGPGRARANPTRSGGFTENGGEAAVERLLDARSRPPRAIVLGNDEMAVGALRALARRGLSVPKDVGADRVRRHHRGPSRPTGVDHGPPTDARDRRAGRPRPAGPDRRPDCSHAAPSCCRPNWSCGAAAAAEPSATETTKGARVTDTQHELSLERADGTGAAPSEADARADWEQRIYTRLTDTSAAPAESELPAPSGLRARPGAGHVRLSWDRVEGAAGYVIERSDGTAPARLVGHGGADVPAVVGCEFADTGLRDGVEYRYRVGTVAGAEYPAWHWTDPVGGEHGRRFWRAGRHRRRRGPIGRNPRSGVDDGGFGATNPTAVRSRTPAATTSGPSSSRRCGSPTTTSASIGCGRTRSCTTTTTW